MCSALCTFCTLPRNQFELTRSLCIERFKVAIRKATYTRTIFLPLKKGLKGWFIPQSILVKNRSYLGYLQTVLLRGAQTTDDTYVNQSNVLTDTWWVVEEIRARAWFRTFLAAAAAFGAVASVFLAILWACSGGGVRYTGEWRPLQSGGLNAGHGSGAPKPWESPSGTGV